MSKTPLLIALLSLLVPAPVLVAGPPEGPSGRLVQDAVPALQDEVKRLEKEVVREADKADDLAVARARLAAAEGKMGEARAAWRTIVAFREKRMARWDLLVAKGEVIGPTDPAILRGPLAQARCGLAEVEGDRAALERELPKVIAYREAQLRMLDELRRNEVSEPKETDEERAIRKELRKARQRLDAVKQR